MKDKRVSNGERTWIHYDLVGIVDVGVERDAPGFVADNPLTMLAGCLSMVTVAVKPGGLSLLRHKFTLGTPEEGSIAALTLDR